VRLRILTYNVHKCVGTDRALSVDRIAEVVRHYDPDVVCLQEVLWSPDRNGHKAQTQLLAEALGMRNGAIGLNCRRRAGVYGNATYSRWPLGDSENIDLTLRFKKARAALYTRVHLRDARVHVFNVHLGLARFERMRQMQDLVTETAGMTAAGEPVVILGDTNDWQNRLCTGALAVAGFQCATGSPDHPGHATFPSWYPMGALDKVFCRSMKVVRAYPSRLALARVASDHLPVIADLDLPPS
jgi:endonuclease/exonuclease/phosphatase family metal-dependent hydrolase